MPLLKGKKGNHLIREKVTFPVARLDENALKVNGDEFFLLFIAISNKSFSGKNAWGI